MRLELISGRSERVLNSSDRFDRLPSMLKRTLPQRNRSQACLADVEPEKERPVVEDHVPKTQTSARWLLGCLVRFGHRGFDPAPRDDRDGGRTDARTDPDCLLGGPRVVPHVRRGSAWDERPAVSGLSAVSSERVRASGWGLDEGRGSSGGPGRMIGSGARTKYRIILDRCGLSGFTCVACLPS